MSLVLTAWLNQRFQLPYDVSTYGKLYTNLRQATWRLQVRRDVGSAVILLEFQTGGSRQNAANTAVYYSDSGIVVFYCPTSALVGIQPGTYPLDFGFILPSADFERVDGGFITFNTGQTAAGVQGSPAAPPGSDATVIVGAGSVPTPVPASIVDALSAANSSALAAQGTAAAATASASAAATSAQAAAQATARSQSFAIAAETSAAAALSSAGLRLHTQDLTVTSHDNLSGLTFSYTGYFSALRAKGVMYMFPGATAAYQISGSVVLWNPTYAAGVHLDPGDPVTIVYSY